MWFSFWKVHSFQNQKTLNYVWMKSMKSLHVLVRIFVWFFTQIFVWKSTSIWMFSQKSTCVWLVLHPLVSQPSLSLNWPMTTWLVWKKLTWDSAALMKWCRMMGLYIWVLLNPMSITVIAHSNKCLISATYKAVKVPNLDYCAELYKVELPPPPPIPFITRVVGSAQFRYSCTKQIQHCTTEDLLLFCHHLGLTQPCSCIMSLGVRPALLGSAGRPPNDVPLGMPPPPFVNKRLCILGHVTCMKKGGKKKRYLCKGMEERWEVCFVGKNLL